MRAGTGRISGPCRVADSRDALHLASCAYLIDHGQPVELASYGRRMTAAARAMDIPLFELEGH